jgi:TRAP-type mannitol/chloroaromatic compound transport system permease small subunit
MQDNHISIINDAKVTALGRCISSVFVVSTKTCIQGAVCRYVNNAAEDAEKKAREYINKEIEDAR